MELNRKVPASLKKLQHLWTISFDFEQKCSIICYFLRMKVLSDAMAIDKSTPEAKQFILTIMDYLESAKQAGQFKESDGITMFETHACRLLKNAENMDRLGDYSRYKNIVKMYFTASMLFDGMSVFKEFDMGKHADKSKFSKWRSTYISTSIRQGQTPDPLPEEEGDDLDDAEFEREMAALEAGVNVQPKAAQASTSNPYPSIPGVHTPASTVPGSRSRVEVLGIQQPTPIPRQTNPVPVAQPAPAPVPASTGAMAKLNYKQVEEVKKLSKFACSSLDYDDIPGAITQFEQALRILRTGKK